MKFGRYLKDTQIPEWKRAYIDYRALKKQIKAIAKARQPSSTFLPIDSDSDNDERGGTDNEQHAASGSRDYERRRSRQKISDSPTSIPQSRQGHTRRESKYGSTGLTPPLHGYTVKSSPSSDGHRDGIPGSGVLSGGKRSESPPPVELPQPALPPPESDVNAEPSIAGQKADGEQHLDVKGKGARTATVEASPRSILTTSGGSSDPHSHHTRSRLSLSRAKSEQVMSSGHPIRKNLESQHSITFKDHPREPETVSSALPTAHATGASTSRRLLASIKRRASGRHFSVSSFASTPSQNLPLSEILPKLSTTERTFFQMLDRELDKIENFYRSRESDMFIRQSALKEQLKELQGHQRAFYRAKRDLKNWTPLPLPVHLPHSVTKRLAGAYLAAASKVNVNFTVGEGSGGEGSGDGVSDAERKGDGMGKAEGKVKAEIRTVKEGQVLLSSDGAGPSDQEDGEVTLRVPTRNPEEYKSAKKDLKKAMLEHYRGLELLNNYRVLNLTGFRKALKKFEKVTKVEVQQAYIKEKVDASTFSSGDVIERMMKEMEDLFAEHFEGGDMKKARSRLRATDRHKTHHFSTFRSGLYLGVALPALIEGLVESFRPSVREELPWEPLLVIYAVFLLPTVFPLLVGLNIWVWARSRINYGFIFELDVRKQLDYREYFELPALLLCLLSYAFWLSFKNVGSDIVSPTAWPLVWLVIAVAILVNPFKVFFPSARWWIIRKTGRQFLAGTQPVEFTDFWLGDQLCSLIFTLSNLYFVGCAYHLGDWDNVLNTCTISHSWGIPFVVGTLPLTIRAVQSVKRYADSKLYTHLINCGKYISSIVYYLFYFLWRHQGRPRNAMFILFCLSATASSIYSSSWDLLMDWSFFKTPAQHRFLRKELIYHNHYHIYYFAMIVNVFIRFIWIIYIPSGGLGITTRTFIAAFLEILRRWQWNFFRLENEHIGNTDQYRVTREVPLPYSFDDAERDSEEEADEEENFSPQRKKFIRMPSISRPRNTNSTDRTAA